MPETQIQQPVYVARQPIFDRDLRTQAYELLFRSGLESRCTASDGDSATLDVIANTFLEIGLDDLTANKPGFINFTRKLLLENVPQLLPPELITVEILEDVSPDEQVLRACLALKEAGYTLALDDFVLSDDRSPFLPLASIVKVDFTATTPDERRQIAKDLADRDIEALAEKVETREEFERAKEDGYNYFQGYFFSKPVVRQGKALVANSVAYLRLLQEVYRPEISIDTLESTIKMDVSLAYRLLRFINSAWFGLRNHIESIRHALVWLGPKEIRKWFALVSMRDMAKGKPGELMIQGITRARMGELLAGHAGLGEHACDLFLMGMFSVLDGLLDAGMPDVLSKLPVEPQIKSALLGEPCLYRSVFDLVLAHERGEWDEFAGSAAKLGLREDVAQSVFQESVKWADSALAMAG